MADLDITVQLMKHMTEQITRLVEYQQKQSTISGESKPGSWDKVERFKNIKVFNGDMKEWEEFATKFRSQAGANDIRVGNILYAVEN